MNQTLTTELIESICTNVAGLMLLGAVIWAFLRRDPPEPQEPVIQYRPTEEMWPMTDDQIFERMPPNVHTRSFHLGVDAAEKHHGIVS